MKSSDAPIFSYESTVLAALPRIVRRCFLYAAAITIIGRIALFLNSKLFSVAATVYRNDGDTLAYLAGGIVLVCGTLAASAQRMSLGTLIYELHPEYAAIRSPHFMQELRYSDMDTIVAKCGLFDDSSVVFESRDRSLVFTYLTDPEKVADIARSRREAILHP